MGNTANHTPLLASLGVQAGGASYNALVSLALTLLLARVFGPERFGDYVAVLHFATLGLILIEGGWPTLVYRESVAHAGHDVGRANRLTGWGLGHQWVTTAVLAALALLVDWSALPMALLLMGCVAGMNLVSARLRGAGRFAQEALWQASGRTLSAAAIVFVALVWQAGPVGVLGVWAGALLLLLVLRGRHWLVRPTGLAAPATYALTLPFLLIELLSTFVFKSEVALLKLFGTPAEALSQFAACTRFNEAALLIGAPAANVLLRSLRLAHDDSASFAFLTRRAIGFALAAGVGAWLGSLWFGEALVGALFGPRYAGAAALLPWTASALMFSLPCLMAVQALVARGSEWRMTVVIATGGLLLLLAMLFGTRVDGVRGGALALTLTHAAILLLALLALRRQRPVAS